MLGSIFFPIWAKNNFELGKKKYLVGQTPKLIRSRYAPDRIIRISDFFLFYTCTYLTHLRLVAQHLLVRLNHALELVHLDLELKELLVATASHRAQQLVLLLGIVQQRDHGAPRLAQLRVPPVGVADFLVALRPRRQHVDAAGEERVQRLDVVGDGPPQVVHHRVAQLLRRLLDRRLDRRRRDREAVDLDLVRQLFCVATSLLQLPEVLLPVGHIPQVFLD
jgi:hypothetical protein